MKKVLQFLFHRVVIVAVFIAIQVLILVGIIWRFNNYFVYFLCFLHSAQRVGSSVDHQQPQQPCV